MIFLANEASKVASRVRLNPGFNYGTLLRVEVLPTRGENFTTKKITASNWWDLRRHWFSWQKKKSHFYDTSWLVFTNPPLCTTWHFKHHHLQTCNPMKQFAHSRPLTPNAVGCYPKFGQRNPTSLRRSMGIHKGNLQKVGHCCTAALSWFWTSTSDL